MAKFAQYAMAASLEAVEDAQWHPKSPKDLESTVSYVKAVAVPGFERNRVSILAPVLATLKMFTKHR